MKKEKSSPAQTWPTDQPEEHICYSPTENLDFVIALSYLRQGKRIRLPEWKGYWFLALDFDNTPVIMAQLESGEEKLATHTHACLRNDWLVIE